MTFMKYKYVSFLMTIFVFNCSGQMGKREVPSEQFEVYITGFQIKSLPVIINRDDMSDLSSTVYDSIGMGYNRSKYPIISDKNKNFIPGEILALGDEHVFRAIYRLPEVNKIIPVILAMDILVEGEQREMWLFLVTYVDNGTIIDYINVSGYEIDVTEKFLSIDNKYQIITKSYQFMEYPDANDDGYSYALETISSFSVSKDGKIMRTEESSKKGYFEGSKEGYVFRRN